MTLIFQSYKFRYNRCNLFVIKLKYMSNFFRKHSEKVVGYSFITPAVFIIGLFGVFPVFFGMYMSLHKWKVFKGRFLGFENYERILGSIPAFFVFILGLLILTVVAGLLTSSGDFALIDLAIISGKAIGFLIAVVVIGRKISPIVFNFLVKIPSPGTFVTGSFIFAMLLGAAAHFVGLHPIVGAFAGGVIAAESKMTHRIREEMKPLNFLLVPIFFVYIGSEVNIQTLASLDVFLYGMLVSLLAFVGKYVSALGAMGKGLNTSLIGIGMSPRGEVGLIFVAVATTTLSDVITEDIISIIIWMVIVTTVIAPILLNRILQKVPLSERDDDERFETPVVE